MVICSHMGFQIVIFRLAAVCSIVGTVAYVVPGPTHPFYNLYKGDGSLQII